MQSRKNLNLDKLYHQTLNGWQQQEQNQMIQFDNNENHLILQNKYSIRQEDQDYEIQQNDFNKRNINKMKQISSKKIQENGRDIADNQHVGSSRKHKNTRVRTSEQRQQPFRAGSNNNISSKDINKNINMNKSLQKKSPNLLSNNTIYLCSHTKSHNILTNKRSLIQISKRPQLNEKHSIINTNTISIQKNDSHNDHEKSYLKNTNNSYDEQNQQYNRKNNKQQQKFMKYKDHYEEYSIRKSTNFRNSINNQNISKQFQQDNSKILQQTKQQLLLSSQSQQYKQNYKLNNNFKFIRSHKKNDSGLSLLTKSKQKMIKLKIEKIKNINENINNINGYNFIINHHSRTNSNTNNNNNNNTVASQNNEATDTPNTTTHNKTKTAPTTTTHSYPLPTSTLTNFTRHPNYHHYNHYVNSIINNLNQLNQSASPNNTSLNINMNLNNISLHSNALFEINCCKNNKNVNTSQTLQHINKNLSILQSQRIYSLKNKQRYHNIIETIKEKRKEKQKMLNLINNKNNKRETHKSNKSNKNKYIKMKRNTCEEQICNNQGNNNKDEKYRYSQNQNLQSINFNNNDNNDSIQQDHAKKSTSLKIQTTFFLCSPTPTDPPTTTAFPSVLSNQNTQKSYPRTLNPFSLITTSTPLQTQFVQTTISAKQICLIMVR